MWNKGKIDWILFPFWCFAEVLLTKITPLKEKVEVIEGGDAMEEWKVDHFKCSMQMGISCKF